MITMKMNDLIKTPCGRSKFLELAKGNGLLSRIRLVWFVIVAALRDLPIPNPDYLDNSNS